MGLFSTLSELPPLTLPVAIAALVLVSFWYLFLSHRPALPPNAPPHAPGQLPVLGALAFFTERWDWYKRAAARSATGNFSFYAGPLPVVGLTGEASRKIFFESKGLAFSEGYIALLGGGANLNKDAQNFAEQGEEAGFGAYFNKRLIAMMKGNNLKQRLPYLLKDSRTSMDTLAAANNGVTEPFDSIYRMVFQLTMRTVACDEIADDPVLLAKCLKYFETIEGSAKPLDIMYPWLPTLSKARRTYAGAQLYFIFKKVVDDRKLHNRAGDDALQYLIDQGDNLTDIITFVLGALFAGQLNSGINAAYILCSLANDKYWRERAFEEVNTVADRYCGDSALPLKERLMHVPMEAWEGEFPIVDLCLKESIRLNLLGAGFRQNLSGADIPLNKSGSEVIPRGAYVALAAGDTSMNPDIYPNPEKWDPARYTAPRNEHQKQTYAWSGWGVGRHPCLGMRFAKLEMSMIVAFFLAYFDEMHLADERGNFADRVPMPPLNSHTAKKPNERVSIKFAARREAGKVYKDETL